MSFDHLIGHKNSTAWKGDQLHFLESRFVGASIGWGQHFITRRLSRKHAHLEPSNNEISCSHGLVGKYGTLQTSRRSPNSFRTVSITEKKRKETDITSAFIVGAARCPIFEEGETDDSHCRSARFYIPIRKKGGGSLEGAPIA